MMHHGAPSPKRTWLWSNMPEIELLNHGTLTKAVREANASSKTVRKYQDSTGKWRFVGTAALSASQRLVGILSPFVFDSNYWLWTLNGFFPYQHMIDIHKTIRSWDPFLLTAPIPGHTLASLARTCCEPSRITLDLVLCAVILGLSRSTTRL